MPLLAILKIHTLQEYFVFEKGTIGQALSQITYHQDEDNKTLQTHIQSIVKLFQSSMRPQVKQLFLQRVLYYNKLNKYVQD